MCTNEINLIHNLWDSLSKCRKTDCKGIQNFSEKHGIIPRSLFFEQRGIAGAKPAIVIGLNPGISKEEERDSFKEIDFTYEIVHKNFEGHYFGRIKTFLDNVGYSGNILWTELYKCEQKTKDTDVPIQTKAMCYNEHLEKEIDAFPEWTIFALGNQVFNCLVYNHPERLIISLPHPTGHHYISRFMSNVESDPKPYRDIIELAESSGKIFRNVSFSITHRNPMDSEVPISKDVIWISYKSSIRDEVIGFQKIKGSSQIL